MDHRISFEMIEDRNAVTMLSKIVAATYLQSIRRWKTIA